MQVKCTIAINHRPSYMRGKYGLTITAPGRGTANVKEIATDEELTLLLLSIGHTKPEMADLLDELRHINSQVKYDLDIDETALAATGF